MFYTTGCVIHGRVALENPAIFHNLIGVVHDDAKVLQENYIGKLKATVTFDEAPDSCRWTLCSVDKYLWKKDNE
ncbi:hypothetical protein COOONC_12503 [Cooperia oncophora]